MAGNNRVYSVDSPSNLNNNIVLKSSINKWSGLNISLLNTRSMYHKFDEIVHLVSGVKLDIVCFVETWLGDSVSEEAINSYAWIFYTQT